MTTYTLNVAVSTGRSNWNNTGYTYVHYCLIELGDCKEVALDKATMLKEAIGSTGDFKFTFRETTETHRSTDF